MSKTYTVKEIRQLTFVTIRTLHYYDEIGLLKATRLKNHHRIYSEHDLIRLQQIMTLKYVGLSLQKIKEIIKSDNFNIVTLLNVQSDALLEEMARIKKISNLVRYLINQARLNQSIDWNSVLKIIQLIESKKEKQNQWYKDYLNQDDIAHFKKFSKTRTQKWINLFKETKKHLHTGYQSEIALKLLRKWDILANKSYNKHPELKQKLWNCYQTGLIPDLPHDKKVIEFLVKAEKYFKQSFLRSLA